MNASRLDQATALLREREARSLTLLLGVGLVGFALQGTSIAVQYATRPTENIQIGLVTLYVVSSMALMVALLGLLRGRRFVDAIGVVVAVSSATMAAAMGYIMWRGFAADAPAALLTKLPIAASGIATIAVLSLTLRPLYVAIGGAGVAATLVCFYGIAAADPATTFSSLGVDRANAYLGPDVSITRLLAELVFVLAATAGAGFGAHFARRTVREAVALQRTTDQLSRYFSPAVAAGIRDGGDAFLHPGGREPDVVVLFADLTGFTRMCAGLPPSEALATLAQYHERMVAEIFRVGGTLDKFIGDGIMATFGTPTPQPDAADRALRAARGMIAAMAELNRERAARLQAPLALRIGVHAGPAIVGNVGTPQRLEFTVIGDTVNVANRIEGACKKTGRTAMLSAAVVARLTQPADLDVVGPVTLDGVADPVELYSLPQG
jgi:adenylate cyclase